MAKPWQTRVLEIWRKHLRPAMIVLIVLSAFRSAVADWNDVPTGSMLPSILEGDRIFVNKLAYDLKVPFTTWQIAHWGDPQRGDIVVFFSPQDGTRLVKRVVGVPGDTVAMLDEQLFVNGQPAQYATADRQIVVRQAQTPDLQHLYINEIVAGRPHPVMVTPGLLARRSFGPVVVPPGKYLMLGDNRDNSFDSRYFGLVDRSQIVGRTSSVILSLDRDDFYLPRWNRFFSRLP